jgi:AbrB family looped-hinge helix DNA binding protein
VTAGGDVPGEVGYVNTANLSPLLHSVHDAGRRGLGLRGRPWTITPPDWFRDVEALRDRAARLLNVLHDAGVYASIGELLMALLGSPGHAVPGRAVTGFRWYRFPMEAVIDQAGRVVLPKPIRDALGLLPGTKVDITPYGAGAQLLPSGRTARLVEEDGVLVADAETLVDDDIVFGLIDAGRK